MSVYTEILAQFNQMMAEFSNNPQLWQDFLKNVCRNYKLRFDEQVLLFAQQPNAIAVGTFDQWFHLYRPVAKGSPAINVFEDYYGKSRRYKRYYEISDTITLANSRPINIWTMQEEYQQSVAETLESDFGKTNAKTFEELIILSAENIVNENLTDYNTNILNAVEGSFLEDLGSDAVLSIYRRIVTSSVAYSMLSRLGYKADSYIDPDEFSEIVNFDTISTMMCLGEATQHMTKIGITSAANSITKYNRLYKEADNENFLYTFSFSWTNLQTLHCLMTLSKHFRLHVQEDFPLLLFFRTFHSLNFILKNSGKELWATATPLYISAVMNKAATNMFPSCLEKKR